MVSYPLNHYDMRKNVGRESVSMTFEDSSDPLDWDDEIDEALCLFGDLIEFVINSS